MGQDFPVQVSSVASGGLNSTYGEGTNVRPRESVPPSLIHCDVTFTIRISRARVEDYAAAARQRATGTFGTAVRPLRKPARMPPPRFYGK